MAIDPSDAPDPGSGSSSGSGGGSSAPPSSSPAGGGSQATVSTSQPAGVQAGFAGMGTDTFQVVRRGANLAGAGPGRTVDVNEIVTVAPKRSNGANVRVSMISEDFAVGAAGQPADEFASTDNPVEVNVRNLNQIFMYSAASATDAIVIRVRRKGNS